MAETYNKMKIDVNEEINDIITEVQGDQNSRYLDVYLYNNGVPIDLTDHTVRIYMCRPKTEPLEEIFNDGEITDAEEGRCQFLLATQALAKVGYLEMQITIWKGTEQILSTHAFKIMVTKNLMSDGSVEASNEYGALVVLFQNLYEAMDLMTEMVQNIGVPAEVASKYDLTTMWQCWEFLVDYMKGEFTEKVDEAIANASIQGVLDKLNNEIAKQRTVQDIYMGVNGLLSVGSTITCTASDNVLLSLVTSEINSKDNNRSDITIGTIKSNKVSGTVRLTISAKCSGGGFSIRTGSFNNILTVNSGSAGTYKTYTADVQIADGGTITFEIIGDSIASYPSVNMATICGDFSEPVVNAPSIKVV